MRRSRTALAAAVITGAALAASCTGPQSTAGANALNIYLYQEPAGVFSPLAPSSGPDNQVMSLIDENLLTVDPDYKIQPGLAQSYDISPDATTFTFHLRPGLKWSDGKPFSSQDVLFTYQLLADPKTTSATAGSYSAVAGVADFVAGKAKTISGFSAPDPNTFVIKASKPDIGLLAQLAASQTGNGYILPQHILGNIPAGQVAKSDYFRHPTVSIGPYKFVDYRTNQYVHVTRNPEFRSPAKIQDIYLKPMTSDVATAQLGNGGIDIASFSPGSLATVQGYPNVAVQEKAGAGFVRIALNQSKPYFQDPRVRQAFLYAVDRKSIVDRILFGKASVQNSDFYAANQPAGLNTYGYDPNKARQLLQQAGWDPNRTVELEWVPGQSDRDAAATVVQNQLGAAGVKVKLHQIQSSQVIPTYQAKSYDMVLYGGGNYAADSSTVGVITGCDQWYPTGGNVDFFCDKQLDQLMAQANGTADPAARKATYDKAAQQENATADLMWLYDPKGMWAVNKRVKGFVAPGSQEVPFWAPASWSITG